MISRLRRINPSHTTVHTIRHMTVSFLNLLYATLLQQSEGDEKEGDVKKECRTVCAFFDISFFA